MLATHFVSTGAQLADIFTKPLVKPRVSSSGWEKKAIQLKCFRSVRLELLLNSSEMLFKRYSKHVMCKSFKKELCFDLAACGFLNTCKSYGHASSQDINSQALGWKWSDNTSEWNDSIIVRAPLHSGCTNLSCYAKTSNEWCTLVTNETASLVAERCNGTHSFICMLDIEDKCYHMHCHMDYLIILAVVSGLILCTTLAVVIWLLVYKRSKRRRKSRKLSNPAATALVPPSWKVFTSEELRSITKNFSEGNRLLGDAKTGGTYSGLLPDGSRVAVKRLKRSSFQRKKEFYSEIGRVARLHHPNLVSVKGCCYDHGDRYIVYEFIANGPLDRWLHHIPRGGRTLDWAMRMKVATSLAQGIAFLHDKVKPQVVHRDIRASNVLLDEDFGAHLMGVGLSKFVPWEVMHERTVMAGGTYGYLAPEFVYRNELTTKSDVYSFGVLLLEIVSGRRPAQAVDSVGWQSIFEWATPLLESFKKLDSLLKVSTPAPTICMICDVLLLVGHLTQHPPNVFKTRTHISKQQDYLVQSVSNHCPIDLNFSKQ
ncbi:hypothetical protein RHMOL_Rhmol01G0081300 [Rhododendron molle]|uniref:Uncharacterized protein n=1 Tax=Rhododendron molle TaxID=49168 RepID=A0ACC0PYZ2_RHOML|nr:hypothetical protein RHMOL_Rhmol01G0081300 [Rhododendron molle]